MNKLDNIINEEINKFILKEKWYNPFSWGKNELDGQDINDQDDLSNLDDDTEGEDSSEEVDSLDNPPPPFVFDDANDDEPPVVQPTPLVTQPEQNNPNYNYNYNTVNASDYVDMNGDYPISNALYKLVQNKKLRNSSRIFNVMKDLEAIGW